MQLGPLIFYSRIIYIKGRVKFENNNFSLVAANPLEAEDLVLQLADGTRLGVSKSLGGLLHGADHGRGATEENLNIGSGGRQTLLCKSLINTEIAQAQHVNLP